MTEQDQINFEEERLRRPNLVKLAESLAACDTGVQAAFMLFIAAMAANGGAKLDDVVSDVIDGACKAAKEADQ